MGMLSLVSGAEYGYLFRAWLLSRSQDPGNVLPLELNARPGPIFQHWIHPLVRCSG